MKDTKSMTPPASARQTESMVVFFLLTKGRKGMSAPSVVARPAPIVSPKARASILGSVAELES